MKIKVIVIASGGMDSAVLLSSYKAGGYDVRSLSLNYGQRHKRELGYAADFAANQDIPHAEIRLKQLAQVLHGSSQTVGKRVPEGHYASENMKATVVPNRNMILLSLAIGHAIAEDVPNVAYGAHAGDHAIYPDCRPEFAETMAVAARLCHFTPVEILRPFINKTKADIVRLGAELGVDFKQTYSCYKGRDLHCGRCGTCVERLQAFRLAGVDDPTHYVDADYAFTKAAGWNEEE